MTRLDTLFPVRHRTIAGGIALGGLLIAALIIAGVMGAQHTPRTHAAPPRETDTITASQPELQAALLAPADLSPSYAPAPATRAPDVPRAERCASLLGAPDELIRHTAATLAPHPKAVVRPSAQAVSRQYGPTLITQVLTTFSGNGAANTLDELRRVGQRCRAFDAVLEDGTAVRVRVDDVPRDHLPADLLKLEGDAFALRFTLTGTRKTMTGYLALGRVGRVLSVLREMESTQQHGAVADLAHFTEVLGQAARKLLPITLGRLGASPAPQS
ncbi:hypothetical protein QEZ54_01015 [Catellatospora sp. KI3]|uniref:hypothetical protein n=1 Tax=Catellatospora sp. KI3 TaxID=3041620 RepID=UPI00248277E7|nr:hypothetical protein [Catellatospora sp. KI3]MDI1459537.1 hypothetical protein [Catellatospora sp. KI3]